MNVRKTTQLLVTTIILSVFTPLHAAPAPAFTPEQEARTGKIAADYLLAHPEVLVQVSQKLQQQQHAREQLAMGLKVMDNQVALLRNADTPVTGPTGAKVAVIEFFDYQCVFCSRLVPGMEQVMKARPDVRYIFKEWPIFAAKWETSSLAAQYGIGVWKAKGAAGYLTYHNGIYHTGHIEGDLTTEDVKTAAHAAGVDTLNAVDHAPVLEKNDALVQALGLTGTPGLIVMPVENATPETITVFAGLASPEQLLAAIDKAQH